MMPKIRNKRQEGGYTCDLAWRSLGFKTESHFKIVLHCGKLLTHPCKEDMVHE